MQYAKLFNKRQTPQTQPIPGSKQVRNSAAGFTWSLDRWTVLDRFLILGSESGTYYAGPIEATHYGTANMLDLMVDHGEDVVERICQVSLAGRAPKNDPAIFALAVCASLGNDKTRAAALMAIPLVCRTGTHLFQFAEVCNGLRGWGRGLRKGIANWYNAKSAEDLEYQAIKYKQREGWTHADLLRLAHPIPPTDAHKALFRWIVDGEQIEPLPRVEAMLRLQHATSSAEATELIRMAKLPREAVPTEWLKEASVWEALLEQMPMTAMVRNLATMTRVGLLESGSLAAEKVVTELRSATRIRKSRLHPMALLLAQRTYGSGHGLKGSGTWTPVTSIVDALDEAFYTAFENVEPTGKRYLLGVDVSGSMASPVMGSSMSACEIATAMAMVTVATEPNVTPMAFADSFRRLPLSKRMRLDDALNHTRNQNFGRTNCALPMLHALEKKLPVDVFVVYTDNETWYGDVHPSQALAKYRQTMGIEAKLIVVAVTATNFTIADPNDAGMLDVVGFDANVPTVMREFAMT